MTCPQKKGGPGPLEVEVPQGCWISVGHNELKRREETRRRRSETRMRDETRRDEEEKKRKTRETRREETRRSKYFSITSQISHRLIPNHLRPPPSSLSAPAVAGSVLAAPLSSLLSLLPVSGSAGLRGSISIATSASDPGILFNLKTESSI